MKTSYPLESAVEAFEHWRTHRIKRTRIPSRLKQMALALQVDHSQALICKKLRINPSAFKSWGVNNQQAFVDMALADTSKEAPSGITLSFTTKNGLCCHLDGALSVPFVAELLSHLQQDDDQ